MWIRDSNNLFVNYTVTDARAFLDNFKCHLLDSITAERELSPRTLLLKVVDSEILILAGVTIWMENQNDWLNLLCGLLKWLKM